MGVLGLNLSACAVQISDFEACALIPGNLGAACDSFLESNPQTLTESQWETLETQWNSQGLAVECTTSDAIGNLKEEIEKLCSEVSCDESTKASVLSGLARIQSLKTKALK